MRVASAFSDHPLPTYAVGECLGRMLETGGPEPDALIVLLTPSLQGLAEDVCAAARSILSPGLILCVPVGSMVVGRSESHGTALGAMGLWSGGRDDCRVRPVRLADDGLEAAVAGLAPLEGVVVAFGDPRRSKWGEVLSALGERHDGLRIAGGTVDGYPLFGGLSGFALGPGWGARTVFARGVEAVGPPYAVTSSQGSLLVSLGGAPALDRLQRLLGELPESRVGAIADGLQVGVAPDGPSDPEVSQLSLRRILGVEPDAGAVLVDGSVAVGSVVRFVLSDGDSLAAELRGALSGTTAMGALAFVPRSSSTVGLLGVVAAAVEDGPAPSALVGMEVAECFGLVGPGDAVVAPGATVVLLG